MEKNLARKFLGIWVPIGLLLVILTSVYFRQWLLTARSIGSVLESQKNDIARLSQARDDLQDIASLQIALRVKLFGPKSAEDAVLSASDGRGYRHRRSLPPSVVSAMERHAVRLVSYRQSVESTQIQFEGRFDGIVRFLSTAAPDMPRIESFLMERADKQSVRLTITL